MKRLCPATLLALGLMAASISPAQAQTAQETLSHYVSDLQKNPADTALREKIIKHVQTMKKKPVVPEAAREHFVMAATFVEQAKDVTGYERAIEQYKAALLAAPWWGDAYKKLAIIQKTATHYDDAIASLNLYLLTQPADARDAQDEIYKLKALKQSAAEEQLRKQREEQQREAPKTFLSQLKSLYEGKTFRLNQCSHTATYQTCFDEAGVWPCGCNEAEMRGTNWYESGSARARVSFPDDSTVLLTVDTTGYSVLRGRVTGTSVEDITWESPEPDTRKPNRWKPVWAWVAQCSRGNRVGPLDCIVYSSALYEFPGMKPPSRPVADSEYSPYTRYEYFLLDDVK
jgi:hypothetical protein